MLKFAGTHPWFERAIDELKKVSDALRTTRGVGSGHVSLLVPAEARKFMPPPS